MPGIATVRCKATDNAFFRPWTFPDTVWEDLIACLLQSEPFSGHRVINDRIQMAGDELTEALAWTRTQDLRIETQRMRGGMGGDLLAW